MISALAALAPLAMLAALQTQAAPPPTPADQIKKEKGLAAAVSRDGAAASVRELTAFGPRMGGTPSGDRAADYLAGRLRALQLDVEVINDPEKDVHWESSWSVELGAAPLRSAWPYGYSPSRPRITAPLRADAHEGPEGSAPIHLEKEQVAGAVILTSGSIREVYARYAREGAVAVLTDAPRDPNRFVDWSPIGAIPTTARQGTEGSGIPVFGLSYHDGVALRRALRDGPEGSVSVTLSLDAHLGRGRPRTIIATLPGAGARAQRTLMVCAHGDSDSGGPGADDNASGVASVLEVARALAAHRDELPADRPTVRLAVWGSEYHSPEAWIKEHPEEVSRLQAVLNYDECGTGVERDALYYEGNDIPFVAPLLRVLAHVAEDYAGQEGFWGAHTSVPALGGTDAYAFLPRTHQGVGLVSRDIPATTIFTAAWGTADRRKQTPGWVSPGWPEGEQLLIDYSAYYHSSGDTPENTTDREPWNMARCARLAVIGIYRMMISTE